MFTLLLTGYLVCAQPDSAGRWRVPRKLTQKALQSVRYRPEADSVFAAKSEVAFLPYAGKIIRHFHVQRFDLNRTVQDTTRKLTNAIVLLGQHLHSKTREAIIRDNIFIKAGQPLNPYRLADNERYLRDLDFILDSRIYVTQVTEDSVDVLVITRDVFNWGASGAPASPTSGWFRLVNNNVLGLGQRMQVIGKLNTGRNPWVGTEWLYRKVNLFGTFIDLTAAYSQIKPGRGTGPEEEQSFFVRLNRPLFMPFARWAGAAEWSHHASQNTFNKEVSDFARYRYQVGDLWLGYSFGSTLASGRENRNRVFVSARVFQQHFSLLPSEDVRETDQLAFANRLSALGQLTWFKQNFYKTKYIFGFGRTEDVPYGYSINLTTGWERQLGTKRSYAGFTGRKMYAHRNGSFTVMEATAAGYLHQQNPEDIFLNFRISYVGPLYEIGEWKVRHSGDAGYGLLHNRVLKSLLDINQENGLPGFQTDSVRGSRRWKAGYQAVVYMPGQVLGFHFAVVPQVNLAWIDQASDISGDLFRAYSLGLRTRNENLVFNTVEVRACYYPETAGTMRNLQVRITANLRLRYPTELVSAPATVLN